MNKSARLATVAWLLTAVYYFYQYIMRSSPSVMMNELSDVFGLSALGVASIVGLFYYGYFTFSLVAGAAMDRLVTRKVVPFGAIVITHEDHGRCSTDETLPLASCITATS